MEDFLFGLLGFVLDVLLESLTDIALAAIVDTIARAFRRFGTAARQGSPIAAASILIIIGFVLGFLSVTIFPHSLVHRSRLPGISLLISPVITGGVMAAIGRRVRRHGRVPIRVESFAYGFAFAFAFALIRFLMVR